MSARLVCAVGGFLLLGACASPGGPTPGAPASTAAASAAFRAADFTWSQAAGKGGIDGQLAYSQAGQAFTCANSAVVLTPETPWVKRRMMILYNSEQSAALPAAEVRGRTPPERSQDYSAFVRRTTCDAQNHFAFAGLPDGAWFVITVAKPVAPGAAGRDVAIMRR
ncbi:MAG: putative lipoprotein, partial [Phenylobacterium sp.]|nr:putative lipoprotein [Phenylobacterium sp.]